ncbi:MAG: acetate--CoA ligase family protein [Anaerolineae bacterium]|nr:acetate--CoA ligase family protein [Anaerolineae bacterium]
MITHDPLYTFFYPRGVAVLGASGDPAKLGYGVLHNLIDHGYRGPVYPVNPRGGKILGLPVYTSVAEVPDPVELAVIILAADHTAEALEACGRRGIRAAVLIASGFGELGEAGEEREARLQEIARRYGMRFIGPNCVGVIDTYAPMDTTFLRAMPMQGAIGFVSHSGAVCGGTVDWANTVGVGFSRIISLGNQADVEMAEALESLAADPHTRVVAAYVEGLPDGRRFVETARQLTPHKPLVVLKAGHTQAGSQAVSSHTGALAGSKEAFQAACLRAGAIQVEHLEALVDASLALVCRKPPAGPRVAILTNAGGPAALAADALERNGLCLAQFSPATQQRLQEAAPPGAMTGNPVDMLGGAQPAHYTASLKVLLAAPEVDGIVVIFVPHAIVSPHEVALTIAEAAGEAEKPVVCCIPGGGGIRAAARALHARDVPHYITPERAVFGIGTLYRYGLIRSHLAAEPIVLPEAERMPPVDIPRNQQAGTTLDPHTGAELARQYGIPVPPAGLASDVEAAVALAEHIGYPVALKRVAPGIVHKSDVGGVALGLRDARAVRRAFARLIGRGEQAFIQKMAPQGLEVIAGAHRDAQFGPLVMFGLGGIYVEVLRDVSFRLAPLTITEAREMIAETAAGRLLAGVRGQPPYDMEAVVATLCRIAQLIADLPKIASVELNPLIVGKIGEGAWAVDVRVVLA